MELLQHCHPLVLTEDSRYPAAPGSHRANVNLFSQGPYAQQQIAALTGVDPFQLATVAVFEYRN